MFDTRQVLKKYISVSLTKDYLSQLRQDKSCYLLQNFLFRSSVIALTHLAQSPVAESGVSWVGAEEARRAEPSSRGGGVGTSELELSRGAGDVRGLSH